MRFPAASLLMASAFLLPVSLRAQSSMTVAPKGGAVMGNSSSNLPFSWYRSRYQQIFAHDAFSDGAVLPMRSAALRMSRVFANGFYGGRSVTLSLYLSYGNGSLGGKPVTPSHFSTTFTGALA